MGSTCSYRRRVVGQKEENNFDEENPRIDAPPDRFVARMYKNAGDKIGASFQDGPTGAVILRVHEGGLLDKWNKDNPKRVLRPGFVIEEVNGVQGYWNLLVAMRAQGPLVFEVSTTLAADHEWCKNVTSLAKTVEQSANEGSLLPVLLSQNPNSEGKRSLCTLPPVLADNCGADCCAICLEDVKPHEMSLQLPCKHAYHAHCAAHWLTQNTGKAQCCQLCCPKKVSTPEGGVRAIRRVAADV